MVDIANPVGGGKFRQYVKDIINAEREPIRQIEARKAKEGERLKLVQEFAGKVRKIPEAYQQLDTFRKFREMKADWPAKDLMDVIVDKDAAEPGEYQIEIVQLAGRHSMISNGYESPKDEIGVGYFVYRLPNGDSKSVFIGPENNTLEGVVSAINGEKKLGIKASLINDGADSEKPWRIVVASEKSGMSSDIEFPDFYFLDGDFRFHTDDERSAQNAIIKFNGFEIMSPTNKFELLNGVSLDLKQAKEDYEFTLVIDSDTQKITDKVKALVDSINGALSFINTQNKIDDKTDTSKTLAGDTTLFTIESRARSWIFENFIVSDDMDDEEVSMRLSDIGIQFEKTGMLSFKEDKFKKNLQDNFDFVANLFVGEDNFIPSIRYMVDGLLKPDSGAVTNREKGVRDRIKRMDDDIARKEVTLERREKQLKRQFSSLETMMNNMQGQQSYLQQAMGSPSLM